MKLSAIEKKLLMLALDRSATDHEITSAAKKFIESLRKRYPSGVELITAIEGGILGGPIPSGVPNYRRAASQDAMNTAWADILREAQEMAFKQQAQRQQSWQEYCATHGNPFGNMHHPPNAGPYGPSQAQQDPPPRPTSPVEAAILQKEQTIRQRLRKLFGTR